MKKETGGKIGDYKGDIGNESARRETKYGGGRMEMKKGGGTQPMYKHGECPKGKPCQTMKVKAPKGYHWMKQKNGSYKLMKHVGKFVKHKGATLEANFPIQKVHKK